ncbi:hypothetical protein D3C87_200800 [compost metagenome]
MNLKIILNDSDILLIEQIIGDDGKNWSDKRLQPIKDKIKAYLKDKDCSCCYCRRSFHGEFNYVIDIEHILPKSIFPIYEFYPKNLNIACKRCNMEIKKARIDFLNNSKIELNDLHDPLNYKFPHPNFEIYEDHLKLISNINGNAKLTYYQINTSGSKGTFTKEYFKLEELEENSLNEAQGINDDVEIQLMSDAHAQRLINLLKNNT